MKKQNGLNLIELMTVVAIIAVLATIALPLFLNYMSNSANRSCMAEVKAYSNSVFVALADGSVNISPPTISACQWITDASDIENLSADSVLDAFPVSPGDTGVRCNLNAAGSCFLENSITNN